MSVGEQWKQVFAGKDGTYRYDVRDSRLLRQLRSHPMVSYVLRQASVPAGAAILEAGVGSGWFSVAFALRGHRVTALDIAPEALENTTRLASQVERLSGAKLHITTVCADLERLPLPPDSFDLVFNEGVVEHWIDSTDRRAVI